MVHVECAVVVNNEVLVIYRNTQLVEFSLKQISEALSF